MTWMTATRRKIRGVLGLGVIGAAIGFVAGPIGDILLRLALMALQGVPDVPNLWSLILSRAVSAAVDWSLLGAFTGTGFYVVGTHEWVNDEGEAKARRGATSHSGEGLKRDSGRCSLKSTRLAPNLTCHRVGMSDAAAGSLGLQRRG